MKSIKLNFLKAGRKFIYHVVFLTCAMVLFTFKNSYAPHYMIVWPKEMAFSGPGVRMETYVPTTFSNPLWEIEQQFGFTDIISPALLPVTLSQSVSGTATFNSNFRLSQNGGGGPFVSHSAPGSFQFNATYVSQSGNTKFFDIEIVSMNLSGGTLPPNIQLRESPTFVSTGQLTVETLTSGFELNSFFDIFFQLSTDGGANWMGTQANASSHFTLEGIPNLPTYTHNANCFPHAGNLWVSVGQYGYGWGFDFTSVDYWDVKMQLGNNNCENLPLVGGAFYPGIEYSWLFGNLPGVILTPVDYNISLDSTSGNTRFFTIEIVQMTLTGSPLPSGQIIRESPTLASTGKIYVTDIGGGNYYVNSFFDIFTELSIDNGNSWEPSQGPLRMVMQDTTTSSIPTLSEWGLIALSVLVVVSGMLFVRRTS